MVAKHSRFLLVTSTKTTSFTGDWEQVHTEQYQTLDDDETVEEIPVSKKEKGKGRA